MGESGENSGIHPVDATEPTLTRADALRLMSERDLRRAVDNGWLTRLRRGVYRLNATMLQLRMHLIAARAPEAVFALLIAAHAWGRRKTVPPRPRRIRRPHQAGRAELIAEAAELPAGKRGKILPILEWAFREDRARQNALIRLDYAILRYSDSDVDLRFGEMIDEVCDTIAWRLGGTRTRSAWDKFPLLRGVRLARDRRRGGAVAVRRGGVMRRRSA